MKSVVKRAVMGGNVIVNDSKDFFDFAKAKFTKEDEDHKEHFKRTVFHVMNIEHNRPERTDHSKTLKGTRKFHAVQAVDKMIINTRNLSCFCHGCISDETDCINKDYVDEWKLYDIKKVDKRIPRRRAGVPAQCRGRRDGVQRGQKRGAARGGRRNVGVRGGARGRKRSRGIVSSSESNLSLPESNVDTGSDTDNSMPAESDEDTEGCDQAIVADQQAISTVPRKDVPIVKNTEFRSPRGQKTRGGARVRGGAKVRGRVRTRGGKNNRGGTAASNTNACVNLPHGDLLPEVDAEGIQDFVMPVELIFDGNIDHHFAYDDTEEFESMDISAILQVVDSSM